MAKTTMTYMREVRQRWGVFIKFYIYVSQALESDQSSSERGVYYRNRAAVHLKLQQYQEAVADCTAGIA